MMKRMQHPMVNIQNISSVMIVDHDAIQSKPLVRFKTRETIFRDPYRLAQRWPSHEGVLYRRAGYVAMPRPCG